MYEITIAFEDNRRAIKYTDIAVAFEFARKDDLDAVKYMKEGKRRWTWCTIPNDYMMKTCFRSFAIEVKEVETGKNIYSVEM